MSQPVLEQTRLHTRLKAFLDQHGEEYGLLSLGYFGSFARGDADDGSDIDIVFETATPNLFLTAMLRQDLEEWLGRPVDVLQLRGMTNDRLKARIQAEAVYV